MVSRDSKPQDAETESGESVKEPVINVFDDCLNDYMAKRVPAPDSGLKTLKQMCVDYNANLKDGQKPLTHQAMKYWVETMEKDGVIERVSGYYQQNDNGDLRKATYYKKPDGKKK